MGEKQRVDLDKRVHSLLSEYGNLGETYSGAVERAITEAREKQRLETKVELLKEQLEQS